MSYTIQIEHVTPRPLAVVRRQASLNQLSTVVPDACGVVWSVLRSMQSKGMGRNVAVYLDEQINLEVGVEMDAEFAPTGEVIASATPGGTAATATLLGPYSHLPDVHRAMRVWCKDHQHKLAGPNWEIYGHWSDDPAKLRTDVFYLLAPDTV